MTIKEFFADYSWIQRTTGTHIAARHTHLTEKSQSSLQTKRRSRRRAMQTVKLIHGLSHTEFFTLH